MIFHYTSIGERPTAEHDQIRLRISQAKNINLYSREIKSDLFSLDSAFRNEITRWIIAITYGALYPPLTPATFTGFDFTSTFSQARGDFFFISRERGTQRCSTGCSCIYAFQSSRETEMTRGTRENCTRPGGLSHLRSVMT